MKIWIDLSNSPHPLLFAPVASRLHAEGHKVMVTARDNAQTVELAVERWPDVEVIGAESPHGKAAKARMLGRRIANLRRWAAAKRPDVALSHNSYAQIVAAWTLGVPAVTAMDYEHQPANHVAFRLAKTILLPELLPICLVRRQGATARKVARYPGLKEELYITDFEPDGEILAKVGLTAPPRTLVVVRTPPSRAIYHPSDNLLFDDVLWTICSQPSVACIVLTRHPEQIAMIASLELPNCIVPRRAVDSRSLIYSADLMIGAGGTMTREAAILGIPTWTMFAGKAPAADLWLEREGMLSRLVRPAQLAQLEPRPNEPRSLLELRERGRAIEDVFVDATIGALTGTSLRRRSLVPA